MDGAEDRKVFEPLFLNSTGLEPNSEGYTDG